MLHFTRLLSLFLHNIITNIQRNMLTLCQKSFNLTAITTIRIATRGSRLALWQANFVKDSLAKLGVTAELKVIKTKGDRIQHLSFDKIEGKAFFTKEIEDALLMGQADIAVHSMKDMPTEATPGLCITAVSKRANPADMLLIHPDAVDESRPLKFKEGAIVGSSSARRKAQMLDLRPDVTMQDIRGNVPTRINKLFSEGFDAILLAAAGLERLEADLQGALAVPLHVREFVPAPAQGVLAYQSAEHDLPVRRLLKNLHSKEVAACTNVERRVLQLVQGGCQMPLGVYCQQDANGHYHVHAAMAESWNGKVNRANVSSSTTFGLAEAVLGKLREGEEK